MSYGNYGASSPSPTGHSAHPKIRSFEIVERQALGYLTKEGSDVVTAAIRKIVGAAAKNYLDRWRKVVWSWGEASLHGRFIPSIDYTDDLWEKPCGISVGSFSSA
jgi:hypothetical protein